MDKKAKKVALRMLVHGIYIVGSGQGEDAIANGVTWLTQASFEPPLIMAAIRTDGRLHDAILKNGVFSVNLVAADQQDMVQTFFKPAETRGGTINGYAVDAAFNGSSLYLGFQGNVSYALSDMIQAGLGVRYISAKNTYEGGLNNMTLNTTNC